MSDFILKEKPRTFTGEITPPGDKSISHRAIILGSLARGKTRASGFLASQDTLATANAFRSMGVGVDVTAGEVEISGNGLFGLREPRKTIDAENSGTTARLLTGVLCAQSFRSTITGNKKRRAEGKNTADSIWLWGEGTRPEMPSLQELYGITGSVVSAVDLVKGIGIFAAMEVIEVPGATGYLDTNYAGKVSGALESLRRVDLAMIHIEATDETGHVGDASLKIQAIEDFDQKVVGPALSGMEQFGEYRVLVLSDHPTPIDLRTHTNEPVPFAIIDSKNSSVKNDSLVYTEDSAASSGIFVEQGWKLMGTLVAR